MKDTKTHLLKTASRLFAKNGYAAVSVREIVRAAKVNIAAVSYYFGDKRTLYMETLKYLLQQDRYYIFKGNPIPTPKEADRLNTAQARALLKQVVERSLELKFAPNNLPIERIFTYTELEGSKEMISSLLDFVTPLSKLLSRLVHKITGLPENSPKTVMLIHSIFMLGNISESDRFVLQKNLGKKITSQKQLLAFLKKQIWQNVDSILQSYTKETTAK